MGPMKRQVGPRIIRRAALDEHPRCTVKSRIIVTENTTARSSVARAKALETTRVEGCAQVEASPSAVPQCSRRNFMLHLISVVGMTYVGKADAMVPWVISAGAVASSVKPPSPDPSWQRLYKGGIGGWRNQRSGETCSDWVPRAKPHALRLALEKVDTSADPVSPKLLKAERSVPSSDAVLRLRSPEVSVPADYSMRLRLLHASWTRHTRGRFGLPQVSWV